MKIFLNPSLNISNNILKNNYLICGLSSQERRLVVETFVSQANATFFDLSSSEFLNDEKIICINKVKGGISLNHAHVNF
jgi:hypothetical protein